MKIRMEQEKDYRAVEALTKEAFWDVYRPGCVEHLIVHRLRQTSDFIKELDLVAEEEGEIVGHIIYSKGKILSEAGEKVKCLTFGPISVKPAYQKQGIGSELIKASEQIATQLGFDAILITGDSNYYGRFGYESASKYGIHLEGIPVTKEAKFFMLKELKPNSLKGATGIYEFDACYNVTDEEVAAFDQAFEENK